MKLLSRFLDWLFNPALVLARPVKVQPTQLDTTIPYDSIYWEVYRCADLEDTWTINATFRGTTVSENLHCGSFVDRVQGFSEVVEDFKRKIVYPKLLEAWKTHLAWEEFKTY